MTEQRVEDASHKTPRRVDIQGLRGIAVLAVVAFHAKLALPGGFVGVDVFFVISGFVIAAMILGRIEGGGKLSFAEFYTRRIRRLLPALALVITVTALASTLLLSPLGPQGVTARTGIAASLISANTYLIRWSDSGYFALAPDANALIHTWSLSVEEQYYLFFPAFFVAMWWVARKVQRKAISKRALITIAVAVATAASFALSVTLSFGAHKGWLANTAFYSAPSRAWEFGVGVLVALAVPLLVRLPKMPAAVLGFAGLVAIGWSVRMITDAQPFPGTIALVPVIGTALVIVAGTSGAVRNPVSSLLGVKPLVWVGDLSYSWYLWHWPAIAFTAAMWPNSTWHLVVATVASLLPAWLSYRWVENPIRFNTAIRGRRLVAMAAVCVVVPILASGVLLVAQKAESRNPATKEFARALRMHADRERGCDNKTPLGEREDPACTWPVENPVGRVVLVGDSNAGHITEPVAAAANSLGYDFTVATLSSCPFVLNESFATGGTQQACAKFVRGTLDALIEQRPSLVVLSSSASRFIAVERSVMDPHSRTRVSDEADRARLWADALGEVLRELDGAGIPVVLMQSLPHLVHFAPRGCPALRVMYDGSGCSISASRESIERQQALARDVQQRAADGLEMVSVVDFSDTFCSPTSCPAYRDGIWLQRDYDHISVDGSMLLEQPFREAIAQRLG